MNFKLKLDNYKFMKILFYFVVYIYFVSSETESAKGEETTKDEVDEATVEDGEMINNNKETKTKSVTAKMTSLLSAMKKSVGSRKEKYSEGAESEVKTPVSIVRKC